MMSHYANRPSQSTMEYVINSHGKKVKNIAYQPTIRSMTSMDSESISTQTIQNYFPHLNNLHNCLSGLHPDSMTSSLKDYATLLNTTTATSTHNYNDIELQENTEISNYLFMVGNVLNEDEKNLSSRALKIRDDYISTIYDNTYPIDGVVFRGIPTNCYSDKDGEFTDYFSAPQQLDHYVENNYSNLISDSKWSSYSRSPGVALSFSYGLKRSMDRYGLSKATHMISQSVYDGCLIAQINPEGYCFAYDDKDNDIVENNDNNEYEVLMPPRDNTIQDIIPAKNSPVHKPIIIVE